MLSPMRPRPDHGLSGTTITLFLSLFLLLLAFFLVLNAHSTYDESRADAVLASLGETFADRRGEAEGSYTGGVGNVVMPGRAFLDEVSAIVEAEIPAVVQDRTRRGAVLEARLRADALFEDGSAALRGPRWRLLDRLIAALAAAPKGVKYEMEFIAGSDYDSTESLQQGATPLQGAASSKGESLAMARAGTFARAMVARGAPPAALAIGMDGSGPDRVRLRFRVVDAGPDESE